MPQEYTEQGLPAAPEYTPEGRVKGSVSDKASKTHAALTSPVQSGPGATLRFLQGMGLPTSVPEFMQMAKYNPVGEFIDHPSLAGGVQAFTGPIGPLINTVAPIPGKMAEGNIAGAYGNAVSAGLQVAPFAHAALADPLQMPVYTQADVAPNVLSRGVGWAAGKFGGKVGKVVEGYLNSPVTKKVKAGIMDLSQESYHGNPDFRLPAPKAEAPLLAETNTGELMMDPSAVTVAKPITDPGLGRGLQPSIGIPDIPQPTGSAPVNSPFIVDQIMKQAGIPDQYAGPPPVGEGSAFGNAPRQPLPLNPISPAKKMSADPTRLANRMEPGDLSEQPAPVPPNYVAPPTAPPAMPYFSGPELKMLQDLLFKHGMNQIAKHEGVTPEIATKARASELKLDRPSRPRVRK